MPFQIAVYFNVHDFPNQQLLIYTGIANLFAFNELKKSNNTFAVMSSPQH